MTETMTKTATGTTGATTGTAVTTRTVSYPGPQLPAVPRFTLAVPDTYAAYPAPGLLAVVAPVGRREPFQPNLTVAADLVPAGTDPAQLLGRVATETAAAYPGTRPGPRDAMVVPGPDGAPGLAVASQHLQVATPACTVDQVVAVYVLPAPGGGLTHAYTLVSSWLDIEHGAELRRIHESFRLGGRDEETRVPPRPEPTGAGTGAGYEG